jgi:thiol-disulfide isomerase/thioredoxin
MSPSRPLLLLLLLSGCASARRLDALEARLSELEAALGVGAEAERAEAESMKLYEAASGALEAGRYDEARELLAALVARYGQTRAGQAAAQLAEEVAVLGQPSGELTATWLQGSATFGDGVTVVVFWELWCPYCQRFVPELQALHEELGPEGVQFAGLTRMTRGATEADTLAFVAEHGLTYAFGVVPESMAERFAVTGIPAAAVVAKGEIVWRGHPNGLDAATLRQWIR